MNSFNKHLYQNALLIYANKEKTGKDLVFMELVFQQRQTIRKFPNKCSADGPGCDTKQNLGLLLRFMLVLSLIKLLRIQRTTTAGKPD